MILYKYLALHELWKGSVCLKTIHIQGMHFFKDYKLHVLRLVGFSENWNLRKQLKLFLMHLAYKICLFFGCKHKICQCVNRTLLSDLYFREIEKSDFHLGLEKAGQ